MNKHKDKKQAQPQLNFLAKMQSFRKDARANSAKRRSAGAPKIISANNNVRRAIGRLKVR